jgi:hypothetical protein
MRTETHQINTRSADGAHYTSIYRQKVLLHGQYNNTKEKIKVYALGLSSLRAVEKASTLPTVHHLQMIDLRQIMTE